MSTDKKKKGLSYRERIRRKKILKIQLGVLFALGVSLTATGIATSKYLHKHQNKGKSIDTKQNEGCLPYYFRRIWNNIKVKQK